jgi:hypothetical protein
VTAAHVTPRASAALSPTRLSLDLPYDMGQRTQDRVIGQRTREAFCAAASPDVILTRGVHQQDDPFRYPSLPVLPSL